MKNSGIIFESDDSIPATKAIHYSRTILVYRNFYNWKWK